MNLRVLRAWSARRSPLQISVLSLWLARVIAASIVTLPLARAVAESGIAGLPKGDRVLFEPGGLWLVELLTAESTALWSGLQASLQLGLLALLLLSVPSALLFATASAPVELSDAFRSSVRVAPRWLAIGVVQILSSALVITLAALVAQGVTRSISGWLTEPVKDLVFLSVLASGLVLAGLLAIQADLVRVVLVRGLPTGSALELAYQAFGRARARLLGGYTLAFGLGVLSIAIAARATELCQVEHAGALRVVGVSLIHAGLLLVLVLIEALWIRRLSSSLKVT